MKDGAIDLFPEESLLMLQGIRDFFGRPVLVNTWMWGGRLEFRGYRPPDCPVGAAGSYHKRGMAFDLSVKGLSAEQARRKMISSQDDERLKYVRRIERDVSWVHVDSGLPPDGKSRIYLFRG